MRVKLWGVRGSLPAPLTPDRVRCRLEEVLAQFENLKVSKPGLTAKAFLDALPFHLSSGYGGNTSCGEILSGRSRLLIDAGSGIREFSDHIMRSEPALDEFHVYFTHYHWDHLIGLPFFVPLYAKGRTIHFYSPDDELENSLNILFRKPNFPVPFEVVKRQTRLHKVEPRQPFAVGDLRVTPYELDHPDACWGVRVEAEGRSVAWAVDTECTRVTREQMGEDAALYRDADLLVFDAQYTFDEALEKINWGHSSGPIGIDLALRENVRQAVFMHHDPGATDETIRQAEDQTYRYYEEILKARKRSGLPRPELTWHFAREGEVLEV